MSYTGSDLRAARIAADITQTELAEILGVSLRTVARIEAAEDEPIEAPGRSRAVSGGIVRWLREATS